MSLRHITILILTTALLAGCACRPGYIGPYGGIHPGRCIVY